MRDYYDFSDSKPNPYAKRMKRPVTIRLDDDAGDFNRDDLWGESATRRLSAAKSLTRSQLSAIQQALLDGCPWKPADLGADGRVWPYGNATSINPMLVTLGASPGNSPQVGDAEEPDHLELPPAGSPHCHVHYRDPNRYWDKVRHLVRTMLIPTVAGEDPSSGQREVPARMSETDAYALFGNMNLDSGRSGSASGVSIDRAFAEWVLRTIRHGLRPRWLICLGLKAKLHPARIEGGIFESVFELDLRKPDAEYQLNAWPKYSFSEWEVHTGEAPLTVVLWPNHPSRLPFKDFLKWCDACEQFKDRHARTMREGA